MDKKQEKLIDTLNEHKKSLWMAFIVLNGGLASLLLSLSFPLISLINLPKLFLLILGSFFDYLLFEGLSGINKKLDKNLK